MEAKYILGSFLDTARHNGEAIAIMHGCNAQGVMGSGAALGVKNKYPEAFRVYQRVHSTSGLKLGTIVPVEVVDEENNPVTVLNAITQETFGSDGARYTSYDAVASVIAAANQWAKTNMPTDGKIPKILLPLIGSVRGGGKWKVIEQIIESYSTHFQPIVCVPTIDEFNSLGLNKTLD